MSFYNKLRSQKLLSFTLILFTLSIGIVIGTLINSGVKAAKDSAAAPGATPLTIPNPVELSNSFTQIAKMVEPSVVNISTTYMPKAPAQGRNRRQVQPQAPDDDQGGDDNNFLFRFFGGNPFGGGEPQEQRKSEALGSGVVVDPAGYILTNNHVVDKADRIQVKFSGDPGEYEAKVVGTDPQTDLAVIRVEGKKNLTPAKIGNSDAVQVGDWALAIGSPFGFQATVTAGIISAKNRDVDQQMQFQHFLQTDAAINPGNSGGPLLNIRGEVIGINTLIASRSGGFQGLGFALPMNTAVQVYNDIIKYGKVTRGSIGVSFTPSDTDRARALLRANNATEGVFIQSVAPGGPAEKAGLKDGDIITSINGKPVHDGNDLVNTVTATPIGTSVSVGVLRDGKRDNYKVVVADLAQVFPDRFGSGTPEAPGKTEGTQARFGMSIQNLSSAQRQNMGLKAEGGVLVASVEPNSFAEDVGLMGNDVIVSLNNQTVNNVADLQRVQGTLKPGDAVAIRILRQEGRNQNWQSEYLGGTLPNNPQ
jgi:serine protease Do